MISFNYGRMVPVRPPTKSEANSVILIHPDGATACGRSSSVATDQKFSITAARNDQTGSAIENELPTYRAISATAVFSVICGGLAVCTFAAPIFYVFSILAVALGIKAHRTIGRYPDILTGRGLANIGITLGLAFGLASGTITAVQYVVRTRQAEQFARKFAATIKSPNMGEVLKFTTAPNQRIGKTTEKLQEEYEALMSNDKNRMQYQMGPMKDLLTLRKRLSGSLNQEVHFVKIEQVGEEEGLAAPVVVIYALARLQVDGPATAEFPETRQYALALIQGSPRGRQYDWWVETVRFPYVPDTFVAPGKPADDGHGHPHH